MPERSPFAKTFDHPPVRRPEWDAVIRERRRAARNQARFFRPAPSPLNAPARVPPEPTGIA